MAGLNLPSLKIDILADGSSAIREIKSVSDAAKEMTRLGGQMTKFTTAPVVAALTAAVGVASDFTETLGKTEVVFGSMTDAVMEWSETSINAMGMAQSTALEMASTYGDMATGMGLAQGAAAQMSMGMTQLAADIASFKNKSLSDVNSALTGIFTGETESLKQLGIVMTQTNLQTFAMQQGITKQISAMSQAEQVQLRYSYVMAQSANAQGDFARTGDSLANRTRKLSETVKELGASFGTLISGKVADAVGGLQQAAQWLAELDDGTKNTILNVGMLVAAAGPLLVVGGKVLTLITGLKTQMALLAANPVALVVGGGLAALTALTIAAGKAQKGLDESSKTYQNLKKAVQGGASGDITIDDTQIKKLEENPPTITINADGQNALDEAQEIADKLNGDEYDGMIAIDGDPEKAETALSELEAAIAAAEAAMTIDADGNAVLDEGGELDRLKAAIEQVKAIVPITTDPVKKAELETYLTQLETQLAKFNINVGFEEKEGTDADIQAFKEKIATLPKNETYSATGEFKISDATSEVIIEYAQALTAAATATGDYAEAVENLNNIVDQETQRKIAEVNKQIAEEAQYQAAVLASGGTTQEEASAAVQQAIRDGKEKIRQIEAEAEAQKKLNETYADGIERNDAPTAAAALLKTFEGAKLTDEQINASYNRLLESSEKGSIGNEQSQRDAQISLNALKKEAIADQEALNAAVAEYNRAMASAATSEEVITSGAQETIDRSNVLMNALENYRSLMSTGQDSPDQVIPVVMENFSEERSAYEGLADELRTVLAGEDGTGLQYADVAGAKEAVTEMQKQAEQQITAATQEAIAARETALKDFQTTLATVQEGFTASETAVTLKFVEEAGIAVSELDKTMIAGGAQAIQDLVSAVESGSGDISGAMNTALAATGTATAPTANTEGVDVGENLTAGVAKGIENGTPAAQQAARRSARMVTQAYKDELDINSPSRVAERDIGNQIIAGVGVGIEKGTQSVMDIIRRSTEGIISSATPVIKNSAYSAPMYPAIEIQNAGIDYEKLADAVSNRPISFAVGARQMTTALRDEAAQQQAVRVQQINSGYGSKGG